MVDRFSSSRRQWLGAGWLAVVCLTGVAFAGVACGGGGATRWGYEGPGAPERWALLSAQYAACAEGRRQSPIDITGYRQGNTGPLVFSYTSDAAAVRNDGRFVHLDYRAGNTLNVGRRSCTLKSAHVHAPSEHLVDGVGYAAELHLLHTDTGGALAVVAVLFELGEPSPVLEEILAAAPSPGGKAVDGFALNAAGYLPAGRSYYRYEGSKTTPPCDEPVDWYVIQQPQTVSPGQANHLLELAGGPTNRPIQPTNGRPITTAPPPLEAPDRL